MYSLYEFSQVHVLHGIWHMKFIEGLSTVFCKNNKNIILC